MQIHLVYFLLGYETSERVAVYHSNLFNKCEVIKTFLDTTFLDKLDINCLDAIEST